MKLREAITTLIKDNNKTKAWVAEKMGYKSPSGVTNILATGNITLENLYKMCELFDYEISIQPKRKTGPRPNGQIVLEGTTAGGDAE